MAKSLEWRDFVFESYVVCALDYYREVLTVPV